MRHVVPSRTGFRSRLVSGAVRVLGMTGCLLVGTGCGANSVSQNLSIDGLAFTQDRSISIMVPEPQELVSVPLIVEWDAVMTNRIAGFTVLIDRSPQPPGKSIDYFALDNQANIYVVPAEPSTDRDVELAAEREVEGSFRFEIPAIEKRAGVALAVQDDHEVVIIPIDLAGNRIGEGFAAAEFTVYREES
jgi:hypothetical protein